MGKITESLMLSTFTEAMDLLSLAWQETLSARDKTPQEAEHNADADSYILQAEAAFKRLEKILQTYANNS